jgi:TRAP-type C4-dicarboxylate transport system permease large subunit
MFLHITVMIGIIIPPMAVNIFVVSKISKVSIWEIYRGVYPFLMSLVFVVFLLILFPQIALFIPSLTKP